MTESHPRPFSAGGVPARTLPFSVAVVLAFSLLWLQDDRRHPEAVLGAALAAGLLVGLIVLVPWRRLPARAEALPPLLLMGIAALLTDGAGATSEYAPVTMLPLLWLAIYGTSLELAVAVVGAAGIFLAPLFVSASTVIDAADARSSILWTAAATGGSFAIQRFVHDLRRRALLASEDYLTGLPNRRAWEERLPLEIARARRERRPLTIAILDLDGFKGYNDAHGHQAGDRLLAEVARAWQGEVRMTDVLARYGGDEFCLALPACKPGDAERRLARLRAITPGGCSLSWGLATWDGAETASSLMQRADEALYAAKRDAR